jgi:hypothetical protein
MGTIARPIRLEPAFDDRSSVHALFFRHAPYPAAAYLPDGSDESGDPRPADSVLPWFRGTWALGGVPRVEGVEPILHNERFIKAARGMFGTTRVVPKTVVVNVNAPMPAGVPHVDVPTFRGADREQFPLRMLIAMGASGLFEPWRVVEAGAISWFYDGPGGGFDYWPDGLDGRMLTEGPPFGNVAVMADSDRMYHRIGQVGEQGAALARMSAAAEIRPASDGSWSIHENGEIRARYAPGVVRLSVLWKAEVFADEHASAGTLSVESVLEIFRNDLRRRAVEFEEPSDPLTNTEWTGLVYQVYAQKGPPKAL